MKLTDIMINTGWKGNEGYDAANDIFAENAWYFRNALVRANYNDLKNGIHETTEYLELFLRNLLFDEKSELHNRSLHVSGILIDSQKSDIETKEMDIADIKTYIQGKLMNAKGIVFNKTISNILALYNACQLNKIFGRTIVESLINLNKLCFRLLTNPVTLLIIIPNNKKVDQELFYTISGRDQNEKSMCCYWWRFWYGVSFCQIYAK